MDKIKESLNKVLEKIKNLSKGKKIAFSILTVGLIVGIVYLFIFFNTTKYAALYKDMDPNDANMVISKLNEKKISYKVENNTIKVPEEKVSELRLELAPQLTGGSKGYEILENSSAFGMTDKERNLKYKIALEGELARNIMSFPEVKKATVLLVMKEDGNFFKEAEPSQASVTLEFQPGKNITKDQIKAIVSLLTGSVKNLSKENVKVIGVVNGKTAELTEDLFTDEKNDLATAVDKQQGYKSKLEKEYEKKIISLLTPKYGSGVKATVDVDVDFDASEKTSTTFDPKNVVKSEEIEKDTNNAAQGNTSAGPVDNNMTNTYTNGGNNTQSTHEKQTRNYEVGKVEQKVVAAPGRVKKVSASVVVNNENITEEERSSVKNSVSAAVGFDQNRGDIINVEGIKFNNGLDDAAAEEAARLAKEAEAKKKMLMYKYIGAGAAALILLLVILIALRKSKKAKQQAEEMEEGIDFIIDDNIQPKEALKPIDFEEENEKNHVEKEIRKYATNKPDQVAEIIKSWMAEDER